MASSAAAVRRDCSEGFAEWPGEAPAAAQEVSAYRQGHCHRRGNRGSIVDVCADPACETHHAESRKARESQERMRAETRKQEEKRRQEIATGSRVLAAILEKVTAPLINIDLDLICREFLNRLPHEHRTLLAERHSPSPANGKQTKPAVEISGALKNLDEAGYSQLLIEISLLDAAHNAYSRDGGERLESAAKRYRVNVQKIADTVAAEFAARRKRRDERRKPKENRTSGPTRKVARKGSGE